VRKKGFVLLAALFALGAVELNVHAELADANPPTATEETYQPFHPNLDEDMVIIETEADMEEENQTVYEEVELNEVTFPDEEFRKFVALTFDTNSDGTLQSDEIREAKELNTDYEVYFSSVKGIEYLKNLKRFSAPMAGISSIDVSNNLKLQILEVSYNTELTSIDVTNNKELRILDISDTPISTVDVSKNSELRWLYCFNSDSEIPCNIKKIDVSHNPKLKRLDLSHTDIDSIDISKNPKLQALNIENTKVISVDTSKNRDLYEFYFKNTDISKVDFTKNWNLAQIIASNTKIKSIDVSHCRNLFVLYVQNLPIREIDFSNCPNLYELFASNCALERLDVSKHKYLNCLEIDGTKISELDIRNSTAINGLSISGSNITKLDVSKNKELKRLELNDTKIQNLDISKNKKLGKLYLNNTNISNLKTLDLSGYKKLEELSCENANIEKLILPEECPDLYLLNCAGNHLKELDLSKVPMLWWDLKYSPQTINAPADKTGDVISIDLNKLVADRTKVTVAEADHYTYDAEKGIITFLSPDNLEFSYVYAHGYQHDANAEPMKVQAKAVVAPEDDEIISGDDKNDSEGSNESNGSKDKISGNEKHNVPKTGDASNYLIWLLTLGGSMSVVLFFITKKVLNR